MEDFDILYEVLSQIKENHGPQYAPIPLFSFEGLPGAGKTTQIKRVSAELEKKYGRAYYIDLPTKSSIGSLMKELYSDNAKWSVIRKRIPWLNVVAMSTDLHIAIKNAVTEGANYAVMSRGLLSTYYYNIDAYGDEKDENVWGRIDNDMKAFYVPNAIIFLDIKEEIAHERVVKRNRGALREMDKIEKMREDRNRLIGYLNHINSKSVYFIDASGSEQDVTNRIMECLEGVISKI